MCGRLLVWLERVECYVVMVWRWCVLGVCVGWVVREGVVSFCTRALSGRLCLVLVV